MTTADWTQWINLGVPVVMLVAIAWALYKTAIYIGHRLFDEDKGLVCVWVTGEQKWRTTLTERIEEQGHVASEQQLLCAEHARILTTIGDSLKLTAEATHVGNGHLEKLVSLHESGGPMGTAAKTIGETADDVQALKRAAIHACDLCESIAKQEFPNASQQVALHCMRIRELIGGQS